MNPLLIAGLAVLVLVIVAAAVWLARRRQPAGSARYVQRGELLTPAEREFYAAVEAAIGGLFRVFPMVRVADVIGVEADRQSFLPAFNRISAKHFDFVICESQSLRPVAALELNDASHQRPDRRQRDEFLRSVCAEAGLPLLEFAPRRSYKLESLRQQLYTALGVDEKNIRREPFVLPLREPEVEQPSLAPSVTAPAAPVVAAPTPPSAPTASVAARQPPTVPEPASVPAPPVRREPPLAAPAPTVSASADMRCPKCGGELQRRRLATGALAGREFWLCRTFPQCSGMRPVATN